MMTRMIHHGSVFLSVVSAAADEVDWMVTRVERQTPKPSTIVQPSLVATHAPLLSVVVELQLMHASEPAPEHVAHWLAQATQAPLAVSKYSDEEHVRRQVEAEERTGRVEGQVRQVSKAPPHVSQSGWQERQVVELEGGAKKPVGQEGPPMQVPLRTSLVVSEHVIQSADVPPEQVEQLESHSVEPRG